MSDANRTHDRGEFVHPEDGKTHSYPSSLESPHHVGHDGKVIYSPAQIEAAALLRKRAAACGAGDASGDLPAYATYEPPTRDVAIDLTPIESSTEVAEDEASPEETHGQADPGDSA